MESGGIMRKNLCPGALRRSMATYSSSVSVGEQPLAWLTSLLLEWLCVVDFLSGAVRMSPANQGHDIMEPCVRKPLARGLAAVPSPPYASGQPSLYGLLSPSTDLFLLLTDTLLKPDQP